MTRRFILATALAVMVSPLASAQPAAPASGSELLLRPNVEGYVQGYQATDPNNGNRIFEYVLEGQTVQDWTEMLTLQDFPASANVAPRAYFGTLGDFWLKSCPAGDVTVIHEAEENGYPVAVVQMICPNNPGTGKPEYAWMKGIQSGKSMYVVQKAFRFVPDREQITTWVRYLQKVTLCDEVGSKHPCPPLK
ncbi:hypothetical protein [Stenotrophomonas sp.]|uniref:hypothetical protein n=1 Tax=Stenotrophomonas sp. TaxID=69392 RepID=UPI002FC61C9D